MEPTHDAAVKLGKNQAGVYLKSCIIETLSVKPKCVCKQTTDSFSDGPNYKGCLFIQSQKRVFEFIYQILNMFELV